MLDIKVTKTTAPKAKPDEKHLGFGNHYTDHMFIMDYTEGRGWHSPRIEPYHSLELDPAALVFHYAQECFEGMKACCEWPRAAVPAGKERRPYAEHP